MRSPEREDAVLDRVVSLTRARGHVGGLSPAAVARLFEAIIGETRAVQESAADCAEPMSAAG